MQKSLRTPRRPGAEVRAEIERGLEAATETREESLDPSLVTEREMATTGEDPDQETGTGPGRDDAAAAEVGGRASKVTSMVTSSGRPSPAPGWPGGRSPHSRGRSTRTRRIEARWAPWRQPRPRWEVPPWEDPWASPSPSCRPASCCPTSRECRRRISPL